MQKLIITALLIMPFFFQQKANAQVKHELIRRVVVFPVLTEGKFKQQAENSWWSVREVLTQNKRFLVASKDFLTKKDVYQPRSELEPADAIILGRLLDAQSLVTTYLEGRKLHMNVYEGRFGRLLWKHNVLMHASLPISEQLEIASKKLIYDFISTVPYQGHVIIDKIKGSPVYKDGKKQIFQAHVGVNARVDVGDEVQLINVTNDSLKPLYLGGMSIETFGEGRIVKVSLPEIFVELTRVTQVGDIEKDSLIRLPKEYKRLKESFALRENIYKNIDPNYFSAKMTALNEEQKKTKPLVTSLAFIGNIALILLLAF